MSRKHKSRIEKLCPIVKSDFRSRNRRWQNPHDSAKHMLTGCNQVLVRDTNNPRKVLCVIKNGMKIASSPLKDSLSDFIQVGQDNQKYNIGIQAKL